MEPGHANGCSEDKRAIRSRPKTAENLGALPDDVKLVIRRCARGGDALLEEEGNLHKPPKGDECATETTGGRPEPTMDVIHGDHGYSGKRVRVAEKEGGRAAGAGNQEIAKSELN